MNNTLGQSLLNPQYLATKNAQPIRQNPIGNSKNQNQVNTSNQDSFTHSAPKGEKAPNYPKPPRRPWISRQLPWPIF